MAMATTDKTAYSTRELIYDQANLQLGVHQLYTDQEPNLEQFERAQAVVFHCRNTEEVDRVFNETIEKVLLLFAAMTPQITSSQLNTNDYPHDFVHVAFAGLESVAQTEHKVRAALRQNEAAVAALLEKVAESNTQVKSRLAVGDVEISEPVLNLKDDQTGKWKGQWWKWQRRKEIDNTLKARQQLWTARSETLQMCKTRIAFLNDMADLLQE
eukprot:143261_1